MGKIKRFTALLGALLLLCPVDAECMVTGEAYSVGASAAIVIEAESGEVLFAQNIHKRLPMASTTKIMTALLTLEQPDLQTTFTVNSKAIRVEGSSMGLQEGDTVSLYALAVGMLLSSGNDAANAAAVKIAGSAESFAVLMNRRASQLGMNNTNFVTPSGLDAEEHYSTAFDMALLGRAAMNNALFHEIASSRRLSVSFGNPPYNRSLLNHNRLLSLYTDAVGVKTGFTKKAGRCLVSAAERDGVRLICVTLNCPDDWNVHRTLFERYFNLTGVEELAHEAVTLPVVGGTAHSVTAEQQSTLYHTVVEEKQETITARVFCRSFYYAPIKKGDILGKIIYYNEERAVGESNLIACATVETTAPESKAHWWQFWK